MGETLKILMVKGLNPGSTQLSNWVWADRQGDSLRGLGCEIDTYGFANRRSFSGLLKGGLGLRKKIGDYAPDLVHVHFAAAQALVTVMFSPKPVVISFCGSDLLGNYDSTGRKTWSGYLSMVLSQMAALGANQCIAKTVELRKALWFSSCREKCEIIPNGVNLDHFRIIPRSDARAILGWLHDDPVVLFVNPKGAWVKNPTLARVVWELAKEHLPNLKMHFVENEPPDRMPLFFNAADVLLITSLHEGSNNTVKEALACNLPVVSSPVGDVSERIQYVQPSKIAPRDARALAQALVQVLLEKSRSNGRSKVSHLSLELVAKRILDVYYLATKKGNK